MAGLPPLNGFISKELMLEQATHAVWGGHTGLVAGLATLGALVSVAYSLRLVAHVFLGPPRDDYPAPPHDPGMGLWLGVWQHKSTNRHRVRSPLILLILIMLRIK